MAVDRRRNLGLPSGVVFPFAGATAPYGYLICDGRAVSRTDYAQLFSAIGTAHGVGDGSTTFNLPDYRGRFLRGVDGSAGVDPDKASRTAMNVGGNTGNNVGSIQGDGFTAHNHGGGSHNHQFDDAYYAEHNGGSTNVFGTASAGDYDNEYYYKTGWTYSSGTIIATNGGNETRPKNAYVNYIIKI